MLQIYLGITYLHQNKLNEAINCFDKAHEIDPNNALNNF